MQSIEDCWNILLCGTFLMLLSAMCFIAFSAITVKYTLHFGESDKQLISLNEFHKRLFSILSIYENNHTQIHSFHIRLRCTSDITIINTKSFVHNRATIKLDDVLVFSIRCVIYSEFPFYYFNFLAH